MILKTNVILLDPWDDNPMVIGINITVSLCLGQFVFQSVRVKPRVDHGQSPGFNLGNSPRVNFRDSPRVKPLG